MRVEVTDGSPAAEALLFLRRKLIAAVATAAETGTPQVAFVYYIVDDDFTVYFMTRTDSRKYRNFTINSRIAVAVADDHEVSTVQMEGDVEVVTEGGELERFSHMLMRNPELFLRYQGKAPMKYAPPEYVSGSGDQYALLRMRPDWLRWMRPNEATGDPEYQMILPVKGE